MLIILCRGCTLSSRYLAQLTSAAHLGGLERGKRCESGGCLEGCLLLEPHMSFCETVDGKDAGEKACCFISVSQGGEDLCPGWSPAN